MGEGANYYILEDTWVEMKPFVLYSHNSITFQIEGPFDSLWLALFW